MNQLIRHRQRVISAVRKPGQALVPNRRATTQLGATFTLGTGAADEGSGQYRLTGPGATLEVGAANAPAGLYVLYYDVINAFVGGTLHDTPKGDTGFSTAIPTCADPVPTGFRHAQGGMVPSVNGQYFAMRRYQQVPQNATGTNKMFHLSLCSSAAAGDYETYGNFKLERYL